MNRLVLIGNGFDLAHGLILNGQIFKMGERKKTLNQNSTASSICSVWPLS